MGTLQGRVRGRVMDLEVGTDGVLRDAAGNEYSPQEVLHPAYSPTEGLVPATAAAGRPMTPVRVTVRRPRLRDGKDEVHEAVSEDGQWRYRRAEHTGTLWDVEHVPTGLMREGVPSLPKARAWTSDPDAAVEHMRAKHRSKLERLERWNAETPGRPDLVAEIERLRAITAAVEEDAPTHAGIALVAADTGRVLMLQRSFADEEDPARGTWEFPGGGLEDGESPQQGAEREWSEEIGQQYPADGEVVGTWASPDGGYVGHIVVIPEEASIDLADGRVTVNPDDPDGDESEQAAWWEVEHARDNPALREECGDSPWEEIAMAGGQQQGGEPHKASLWDGPWGGPQPNEHADVFSRFASLDLGPGSYQLGADYTRHILAHFGDLDVVEPDVPAEAAGVENDPEHALPVTYGEDAAAAPVLGRLAGLTQDWRALREGPTQPATEQEMRAGTPVIAPCGCLLAGTNSSARQCQVAPAGQAPSREVVRHIAEVRRAGRFAKAASNPVTAAADPYAHLLAGGGGGDDDLAAAAQRFLGQRTALKDFTPAERRQIIDEGAGGPVARNASALDLSGTHYNQMPDPGEADDDWMGWL